MAYCLLFMRLLPFRPRWDGLWGSPQETEDDVEKEVLEGDWRRREVEVTQVDVETGEEKEDGLFKERAKLFRFAQESSEWKQRGIGDAKILKHSETGVLRFLFREEK
eukprot:Filipodium_phascolosomae@DN1768_c0_g1_i3.p1